MDLAEVTTYWRAGGSLSALRDLDRTVRGAFGLALREPLSRAFTRTVSRSSFPTTHGM